MGCGSSLQGRNVTSSCEEQAVDPRSASSVAAALARRATDGASALTSSSPPARPGSFQPRKVLPAPATHCLRFPQLAPPGVAAGAAPAHEPAEPVAASCSSPRGMVSPASPLSPGPDSPSLWGCAPATRRRSSESESSAAATASAAPGSSNASSHCSSSSSQASAPERPDQASARLPQVMPGPGKQADAALAPRVSVSGISGGAGAPGRLVPSVPHPVGGFFGVRPASGHPAAGANGFWNLDPAVGSLSRTSPQPCAQQLPIHHHQQQQPSLPIAIPPQLGSKRARQPPPPPSPPSPPSPPPQRKATGPLLQLPPPSPLMLPAALAAVSGGPGTAPMSPSANTLGGPLLPSIVATGANAASHTAPQLLPTPSRQPSARACGLGTPGEPASTLPLAAATAAAAALSSTRPAPSATLMAAAAAAASSRPSSASGAAAAGPLLARGVSLAPTRSPPSVTSSSASVSHGGNRRASARSSVSLAYLRRFLDAAVLTRCNGARLTTRQVVEAVIAPACTAYGCRYPDAPEPDAGPTPACAPQPPAPQPPLPPSLSASSPGWPSSFLYVVHAWDCCFADLVALLEAHAAGVPADEVHLWIDIFAHEQELPPPPSPSTATPTPPSPGPCPASSSATWRMEESRRALRSAGGVLLCLLPGTGLSYSTTARRGQASGLTEEALLPLRRCWCLWELATALRLRGPGVVSVLGAGGCQLSATVLRTVSYALSYSACPGNKQALQADYCVTEPDQQQQQQLASALPSWSPGASSSGPPSRRASGTNTATGSGAVLSPEAMAADNAVQLLLLLRPTGYEYELQELRLRTAPEKAAVLRGAAPTPGGSAGAAGAVAGAGGAGGSGGSCWQLDGLWAMLRAPSGPRCVVVTGRPGSGKSTLAAALYQPPPPPPAAVAVSAGTPAAAPHGPCRVHAIHLCSHADARRQDPMHVVRSLSYQLAVQLPAFRSALGMPSFSLVPSRPRAPAAAALSGETASPAKGLPPAAGSSGSGTTTTGAGSVTLQEMVEALLLRPLHAAAAEVAAAPDAPPIVVLIDGVDEQGPPGPPLPALTAPALTAASNSTASPPPPAAARPPSGAAGSKRPTPRLSTPSAQEAQADGTGRAAAGGGAPLAELLLLLLRGLPDGVRLVLTASSGPRSTASTAVAAAAAPTGAVPSSPTQCTPACVAEATAADVAAWLGRPPPTPAPSPCPAPPSASSAGSATVTVTATACCCGAPAGPLDAPDHAVPTSGLCAPPAAAACPKHPPADRAASAGPPAPCGWSAAVLPVSALRDDAQLTEALRQQLVLRLGPEAGARLLRAMLWYGKDLLSYYVTCMHMHNLCIDRLPGSLEGAFGAVFGQEWKGLSQAERTDVQRLLAALAAAQEPLPPGLLGGLGLQHALHLLPGWGQLFVQRGDGHVAIASPTLAAWLRCPDVAARTAGYGADLLAGHAMLAAQLYGDVCGTSNSGKEARHVTASVEYGRRNLAAHLAAAVGLAEAEAKAQAMTGCHAAATAVAAAEGGARGGGGSAAAAKQDVRVRGGAGGMARLSLSGGALASSTSAVRQGLPTALQLREWLVQVREGPARSDKGAALDKTALAQPATLPIQPPQAVVQQQPVSILHGASGPQIGRPLQQQQQHEQALLEGAEPGLQRRPPTGRPAGPQAVTV